MVNLLEIGAGSYY